MSTLTSQSSMIDQRDAERRKHHAQRKAMLGTLASGMAHELRNILMPVLLRLDVLTASSDLPDSARHDLVGIRKSMRHLQHLAEGLRLLSPDAAIQPAERPVTSLPTWWADFRPVIADTLPPHAIVNGEFHSTLPLAAIPQSVLAQVVISLVMDALPAVTLIEIPCVEFRVTVNAEQLEVIVDKNFAVSEPGQGAVGAVPTTSVRGTTMRFGHFASRELLQQHGGDLRTETIDEGHDRVRICLRRLDSLQSAVPQRVRVCVQDPRVVAVVRLLMHQRGVTAIASGDNDPADLTICDSGTLKEVLLSKESVGDMQVVVLGTAPEGAMHDERVQWLDVNNVGALYALFT